MSTRNLELMMRPASVALVLGGQEPSPVAAVIARNLSQSGFRGSVWVVGPDQETVEGIRSYSDIEGLPRIPDLAVIVAPPDTVPQWISRLGARGTKAALVVPGGFDVGGREKGDALRRAMLNAARPHLLRVLGPDTMGLVVPGLGLNASLAHLQPLEGKIAFIAQSNAIMATVLDWATSRNIGFSHLVSLGEMADVDMGDLLDYLAREFRTRAILLYLEGVTHARKFMSAARAAARAKTVVVLKGGRHPPGITAATAHTGRLVGPDAAYDAAFRRAGMLRVQDIQELFAVVETLAMAPPALGDRLAIVTNGGGVGVLATDSLTGEGGRLAEFTPETLGRLQSGLPADWVPGNPVDVGGDAPADRYVTALETILKGRESDAVLVMHCPSALTSGVETARSVAETLKKNALGGGGRPVLTNWLGDGTAGEGRRLLVENRIPTYETPHDAVRAFMQMVRYRRNQEMLMETPPSIPEEFAPNREKAGSVIDQALREGRSWLRENEAQGVCAAYGIPMVFSEFAASPEDAAAAAERIGVPVALKICSPDIHHKSRVGGVVLNLGSPESVKSSASAMMAHIRKTLPSARLEGFSLQPMTDATHAHELIVGMTLDADFGPVILFGRGGIHLEAVQDTALCLPPLNLHLAREVMGRTRIGRLLLTREGDSLPRGDDSALVLVKVSQLICDMPEIVELDINPLMSDGFGCTALDVRIRVARAEPSAANRLAIRPYPKELEETVTLPDGQALSIRPIRPEDEPGFYRLFSSLSPDEIRLRFLQPMQTLPHSLAARLTQIDYDREMALVLVGEPSGGEPALYGVVHVMADPDNETAEFAILVHHCMTGMGLGPLLLGRIIDHAKNRGISEIFGEVSTENKPMLKLCKIFGFTERRDPDDPGVVRVTLKP